MIGLADPLGSPLSSHDAFPNEELYTFAFAPLGLRGLGDGLVLFEELPLRVRIFLNKIISPIFFCHESAHYIDNCVSQVRTHENFQIKDALT